MNLLKDMELFVKVVHCNGLAAAGRELGMTPSSVSMRIKKLEEYYQTKLLTRTTRKLCLTNQGEEFYRSCLVTIENLKQIELKLKSGQEKVAGTLRITATSDLGRQHIVPLINDYVDKYPEVVPCVNLSDGVTHITENNIDVAIRYGIPSDSQLIAKKLLLSKRVLCASPKYLEKFGIPKTVSDLDQHRLLSMVQIKKPLTTWYFNTESGEEILSVKSARICDDGAQVRQWALEGAGIALKSIWDVVNDLQTGQLVTVLDAFRPDYKSASSLVDSDLYVVYRDRRFLTKRMRVFVEMVKDYFLALEKSVDIDIQRNE